MNSEYRKFKALADIFRARAEKEEALKRRGVYAVRIPSSAGITGPVGALRFINRMMEDER